MSNTTDQKTTDASSAADGRVGSSDLLADKLRQMIELIEAHEVTCFSCDRDGERYCDCLQRMVKDAKKALGG
jgi:hypothetical protein